MATMNQLNSSTIAWRRMLISTYNHLSLLPVSLRSFFALEKFFSRTRRHVSSNPYKLSLCDEKKDKFEKEKYAIRDGSVHIYISSSRGFRDSTFRVDTNLPVSLVSLAPPKLAIKLHPRTRDSKKPRSLHVPFEFSNRRGEKFKYKIESDTWYLFSIFST